LNEDDIKLGLGFEYDVNNETILANILGKNHIPLYYPRNKRKRQIKSKKINKRKRKSK